MMENSSIEQLSICLHYVVHHLDVSEQFLSFFDTGLIISPILFSWITDVLIMCIILVL